MGADTADPSAIYWAQGAEVISLASHCVHGVLFSDGHETPR